MTDTRHAVILEGAEFCTDLEGELEKGAGVAALLPDRAGG